jgi:hypothetical protein
MRTVAQSAVRQSSQQSLRSLIIRHTPRLSPLAPTPPKLPLHKSKLKVLHFGMARTAHIAWA